jgi:hypothetical protein
VRVGIASLVRTEVWAFGEEGDPLVNMGVVFRQEPSGRVRVLVVGRTACVGVVEMERGGACPDTS